MQVLWPWLLAIPILTVMILCLLLVMLIINLSTFARLRPDTALRASLGEEPLVSVLIPARNEARCIGDCVRSLLAQNYENLEILVLDDQSTDTTTNIILQLQSTLPSEKYSRLRLLAGAPLPVGWVGKNYACQQLFEKACGEYLFFTDADTVHEPQAVRTIIDAMQQQQVQLLTGQPEHMLGSIGERLIIPLLNFTILTLLPVALVSRINVASLATGNGQLMCFEHNAYAAIGGHKAVKGKILEDVLLARRMKAAGYCITFIDALEIVHCRMYHSSQEIWQGFSKNLFALYNYSLPFACSALFFNLLLFIAPPIIVLAGLIRGTTFASIWFELGAYLLAVFMRILLTFRFTRTHRGSMLLISLLHPLAIFIECLILINSIHWHYRPGGTIWKGRQYTTV